MTSTQHNNQVNYKLFHTRMQTLQPLYRTRDETNLAVEAAHRQESATWRPQRPQDAQSVVVGLVNERVWTGENMVNERV